MGPQVAFVRKSARTMGAGKRLLSGVGSHVSLQQPGAGEGLATVGALAGQRVCPDVHLQGGQGVISLIAELAGEVAADLVGAVQLLVLGEA